MDQEEHEIVVNRGGKSFRVKVKGSMTFDQLEAKISREFDIPLEDQHVAILSEPTVTNVNINGDLRVRAKVWVTGTVIGGTDGSSRVQWYKSHSSTLDESNLEVLSTSTAVAKVFRIPPKAVGCYIVAKFTPMSPDGRAGEPTFVISDRTIECRE